ncbi:hypothetical protein J3E69DRAFT_379208 [Trichoderma sp. SZMC 28015]
MSNTISSTGLSVVYEAENSPPIVDIVFVHGLQGHPSKTWTYRPKTPDSIEASTSTGEKEEKRKNILPKFLKSSKVSPTGNKQLDATTLPEDNDAQPKPIFWPADLLPNTCPDSRILTFGYDSKITKYNAGEINPNGIFSHSKDLLLALRGERERDPSRRLVFVAHSLGGIVVKEMLARSSSSVEDELRNIVESTALVLFLGTPHRGSQDVAALGEVVRFVVSSLGMETTPALLDPLRLKTTDLIRVQEDFSALWQKHDFRVKTFQEGLILAKLRKKVVPDYSSLIGDYREHAETLQANHIEMCRYSGPDDPNYRKVAGELRSIYRSIPRLKAIDAPSDQRIRFTKSVLSTVPAKKPRNRVDATEACLASLHEGRGLLWLKGKPGAGKSMLIKEAFHRAALEQVESNYRTAAFFFNAKGVELEHSSLGLYKSLLYQLLPRDRYGLLRFHTLWEKKSELVRQGVVEESNLWSESELENFLESILLIQTKRSVIFIDAQDECDEPEIRPMAYFWRLITRKAYASGIDLDVCISSRHFPTVTLSDCPTIIVEQHNSEDIKRYVDHKFKLAFAAKDPQWEQLKGNILQKSAGVFLWVVLVVEDILKSWDEGKGMSYLIKRVMDVPEELEILFSSMFSNLEPHAKEFTIKFFQWAILAAKPLRLHEWRHILAFIRQPALKSLSEWRQSDNFIENDEQLEKQIRSISRGLVEVDRVHAGDSQEDRIEAISIHAGAGSLDLEHGDTRIVQVIHESVREFFLKGNGFFVLDPGLQSNPIGNGHLSIMETCLDYLNIKELNALVQARIHAATRMAISRDRRTWSAVSRQTKSSSSDGGVLIGARSTSIQSLSPRRTQFPASFSPQVLSNMLDSSTLVDQAGSHDSLFKKEHLLLRSKKSATREEETSESEIIRSLVFNPSRRIVEWLTKGDAISVKSTSPNRSPCASTSYFPAMGQQRLLEDDPTLLSYATFKLFTHVQLADQYGADLRPFIKRLKDEATWARWIALREDIPDGTKAIPYILEMGLWSWVNYLSDGSISDESIGESILRYKTLKDAEEEEEREKEREREEESLRFLRQRSKNTAEREKKREKQREKERYKASRRSQSVASFSSAGSHRA